MKKYLFLIILISFSLITCKSNGDNSSKSNVDENSNKLIENFYKAYNNNDYEQIADLCARSISTQVKKIASDNFDYLGKNISHIQYSKKYIKKNGIKTKVIAFKCKYEKLDDVIYEKFFIDTKNNKLSSYIYSGDKKFIDNYENYSKEATDVARKYYDNLMKDNLSVLDELLDKQTNFGDSITEKYIQLIKDRRASYGKIKSYFQININTYLNKGKVTITQRFECKTDKNTEVYEELRFILLNEKFKIYDYYYAPDYKTLVSDE